MDDRRRSSSSYSDETIVRSQLFQLVMPYRILIPAPEYRDEADIVIIFSKEDTMKYDELLNAHLKAPSASMGGEAVLYFTDIHRNVYATKIPDSDYRLFSDKKVKRIAVGDIKIFRGAAGVKNITKINLFEKV